MLLTDRGLPGRPLSYRGVTEELGCSRREPAEPGEKEAGPRGGARDRHKSAEGAILRLLTACLSSQEGEGARREGGSERADWLSSASTCIVPQPGAGREMRKRREMRREEVLRRANEGEARSVA